MNAPVTVNIDVPDDYAYADFDYTSTYDGPTSWSDEVYGYDEWSGTYSHTFLVCPSYDNPGTYMGHLDVTFYDYDGYTVSTAHANDAFKVRAYSAPVVNHTSTLGTSLVRTGTHGWTVRATTKYDNDAWVGHRVNLQQKRSGSWHTVKSAWTNSSGRADLSVTPAAGAAKPYRAVSTGNTHVSTKVSQTYWLNRR